MEAQYDRIGETYARYRRPDPRWAAAIDSALGRAAAVVDVGSGTGSYEPRGRRVVAVEPSRTMIDQRPKRAAPVLQAVAEHLPFPPGAFDAALAVLTIHHWSEPVAGLRELARVASRQVVLTWDGSDLARFWIAEYLPEWRALNEGLANLQTVEATLDVVEIRPVPVPWDCTDGFGGAYWRRPEMYLDPGARSAISGIALMKPSVVDAALRRLDRDLHDGTWARKYGSILDLSELDLGYRIAIGVGASRA